MPQAGLMIRDFPQNERPRERLLQHGPQSLSNQELLAILLRTGSKSESVIQLANRLLTQFDGLLWLRDASVEEMMQLKGIGEAKKLALLKHFGSVEKIRSSNIEELTKVSGITEKLAQKILEEL